MQSDKHRPSTAGRTGQDALHNRQRQHVVVELEEFRRQSPWRVVTPPWPAGSLLEPAGIACAPDGRVIVVDRGHHRLVVLSPDRTTASALGPDSDPIGALWSQRASPWDRPATCRLPTLATERVVRCHSLDVPSWSAFGRAGSGTGEFVSRHRYRRRPPRTNHHRRSRRWPRRPHRQNGRRRLDRIGLASRNRRSASVRFGQRAGGDSDRRRRRLARVVAQR